MEKPKEVRWIGSSKKDLLEMPLPVRKAVGFVLDRAQRGKEHSDIKPLTGLGSGVYEIRADHDNNTYRAVYVINIGEFIYVLHIFKKKSKKGIETPKPDINVIQTRLKQAKKLEKESSDEQGKN